MDILKEVARVDALACEKKYAGKLRIALRDMLNCSDELGRARDAYYVAENDFDNCDIEADALDRAAKQMAWADSNARRLLKEIDAVLAVVEPE